MERAFPADENFMMKYLALLFLLTYSFLLLLNVSHFAVNNTLL